jgi:hypothetical protein
VNDLQSLICSSFHVNFNGTNRGRITAYSDTVELWKSCRPSGSYRIVSRRAVVRRMFFVQGPVSSAYGLPFLPAQKKSRP